MVSFIRKHMWSLVFIGGVSYLFITANPIDYCEKQGRYLSDQEYIDKVIMKQAVLLKEGYPDSIGADLKKYKRYDVSEEESQDYYQILKHYFENHPKDLVIWRSNRHRYTTNARMPINIRMRYIPNSKDCEYIMKNNHFEDYSKLTEYEKYGYETQWIKQICTGADSLEWHYDKDTYIPEKKKMIGYSTRFISSSCGDEMFSTGFESIFTDIPLVDIAPTFVEKYLK